ncbi:MAG: mandelate racemase/muconate lactonizing enzyme family protein, partial [Pseudomonadota bacterium]|nr:mandelate racemase/muconate lactonizing enzyme family protein [Pseudomonadota bacterium]
RLVLGSATLTPLPNIYAQNSPLDHEVIVTDLEVIVVNVTQRTKWIFVLLTASNGVTGLGEASLGRRSELNELNSFFRLVEGQSPFDINLYRTKGWPRASSGNRAVATAFSAIEQALWDIVGKTLNVPVYQLFGGKLRDSLPVYANINRATSNRTPEGFAEKARQAVADGFKAIKAAPFDGFPPLTAAANEISSARQLGVDCVFAMREAIGDDIAIKVDAHSFFDVELSISVAQQLLPANLSWYEEPIAPTQTTNTRRIHESISQTLAGGEFLFGVEGFTPLCEENAVDIIMPDIKHCGGLLEAFRIAAVAEANGVKVSPHNPSGPVSTAASIALCAALPNFEILEYQWGEQPWRSNLVVPNERFVNGAINISNSPGFGIAFNERVLAEHRF